MLELSNLIYILLVFIIIGTVLICIRFRSLNVEKRRTIWFVFTLVLCVFFLIYKFLLFFFSDYDTTIWNELPFQLCNVTLLMLPFAIRKTSPILSAFCFYFGGFGAIIALITPIDGFSDITFFSIEFLYYWYHCLLFSACLGLLLLDLYTPKIKDIIHAAGLLLLLSVNMHIINIILRLTVYSDANYFFTFSVENNVLSEIFYSIVSIPLIYLILPILFFASVFIIITKLVQYLFFYTSDNDNSRF